MIVKRTMMDEMRQRLFDLYYRLSEVVKHYRNAESYQDYVKEHPFVFLAFAVLGSMSLIPVLAFVGFLAATMMFTVLGFLFLEGTLLTVGIIILSGVLFTIGVVTAGFTTCMAIVWFVFRKLHRLISGKKLDSDGSQKNIQLWENHF